ncbi:MAG: response regulator receiver sensor signal transduction histidine kinase [Ramlibacter sp.]|nr:response regulator receiver sensor signal transduction histidine kinase [Ramlibacter sp.]
MNTPNPPPNRRILLIDDMPSIHEDFRKILDHRPPASELDAAEAALFDRPAARRCDGFDVDSAYQGREGAALAEAALQAGRPYAMAFVDMRMPPGWDGVETIEQLWRIDPRMQVVVCTAHADHPWEEVLARLDVQDRMLVLKKPFDLIEVSQLARMLTAKWDIARQSESQVTSLEQAVQELRATESALRQSNSELELFAHSLSHDLRAPLSVMSSFSGLLAKELDGPSDKVRHYLSRIQASAALGEELIEGLLVLDRVSRTQLSIEPVDLSGLSRKLLQEYRSSDPQRDVSVEVQDDLQVHADRRLTQLAMKQLLDNAWKFTSLREHARIEVGMQEGEDGEPVYYVRDNGSGLDAAYADKLFRIFQRLHTINGLPGTGVGLVTARRAIDRQGGKVWADTQANEGATFHFTLPSVPRARSVHESRIGRSETGVPS